MPKVVVDQGFFDWDNVKVQAGTYENATIERKGYANNFYFWNIVCDGAVLAVTKGHPPMSYMVEE